jgi:hypothetical protein
MPVPTKEVFEANIKMLDDAIKRAREFRFHTNKTSHSLFQEKIKPEKHKHENNN